MSDFNVEKGLVSKLLECKDVALLRETQIKPSYFSGEHKNAFQFILDSVKNNGEVPTVRAFERKFPNYELDTYKGEVGTEENFKFWCDELRVKVKHNSIADTLEKAVKQVGTFNTEEAYSLLKKEIAFIESEVDVQPNVDITKDTDLRKEAYERKKENKGMLGLSYGLRYLDYITKGLQKETLTTMIAGTGVGKTFFEVLLGSYCQLQGCTVLQFVTEMSEEIMRDRYEAMLYSMCYGDFNYNDFKSGALTFEQEQSFFRFLEEDLPNFEPLIIITATSAMSVAAEIEKYHPDIVLIDGVYLMEDDEGAESDWLRIAHITRDLKKLAKRSKLPFFINSQADKNTSKRLGPELGNISYSQAIAQDSDVVLTMYRDEVMIQEKEMCLKVLKQREGMLGRVTMQWDFAKMGFSEIFAEKDNEGSDSESNLIDIED